MTLSDKLYKILIQGGIQNFGEKYGLMPKKINRLQICCEELVYEMLAHCYGEDGPVDMQFEVSYAELDQTTEITLDCGGAQYDPFRQDEDGLGVTILKHMASSLDYTRKGNRNLININL